MKKGGKVRRPGSDGVIQGDADPSAFLQKLIDSIPLPIFYKDAKGIYSGGNREFANFIGRKIEDIVGRTVHEIAPQDLADIYEQADKELFRRGGSQTYECAIMHADGTRHIVVFNKATFNHPDGTPCGLIGSIFDITLRKKIESALLCSEAKYRRIFDNIQDIYYEMGIDGTLLEISPSIEKYVPFKREDLLGRSIDQFDVDKNKIKDFLLKVREKGYVRDFEIELRNPQGALLTCSIVASLLPGDERLPPRIIGSLRDISERKQAEEILRQSEEELSIKSRNLEEVNTALKVLLRQRERDRRDMEENMLTNVKTSLLPYIKKLKEGPLTPHQMDCLRIIEAQLEKIVSPFLSRISQTCFDLTPQEIRVADLVKNGSTTKEISRILGISIKTVDYHRDNIRRKLGIKNHHTNLRSFLLKLT